MKEVVITNPLRTPTAASAVRSRPCRAYDLAKVVMQRVIADAGIDAGLLDEVILGNIGQPSDAANIARVAAIYAGIPEHVPAYTVQRNCASGIQAIMSAYQSIQADDGELFLVGGTENMSQIPYIIKGARWGLKLRHAELTDALWEGLTDPTCNLIMGARPRTWPSSTASPARRRTSTPSTATRRRLWRPAWASSRTRSCPWRW